jgi:hypothetical protein
VEALIEEWSRFVTELPGDTAAARTVYFSMRGGGRRLP